MAATRGRERDIGGRRAAASVAYSTNARTSSDFGDGEKRISGGANQTTRDCESEEDGAAEDARHLAPSATGDGLMPP